LDRQRWAGEWRTCCDDVAEKGRVAAARARGGAAMRGTHGGQKAEDDTRRNEEERARRGRERAITILTVPHYVASGMRTESERVDG
jgi:hypothetical protein